ncbi:hypothetical protein QQ045_017149 [Rhodiola kirilowii]
MNTPNLYVNPVQVMVGRRPVTGMRLFLEGMNSNRLAIYLQHLSNASALLQNKIKELPLLCASSDQVLDNRFVEPIRTWNQEPGNDMAYIVTGAQLHVKKLDSGEKVLHLWLLYSCVVDSYMVQSSWAQSSDVMSNRRSSGLLSTFSMSWTGSAFGLDRRKDGSSRGRSDRGGIPFFGGRPGGLFGGGPVLMDSAVFPGGPPAVTGGQKHLQFVEVGEVCRGPQDSPGHWLVTGARLELENGKICLHQMERNQQEEKCWVLRFRLEAIVQISKLLFRFDALTWSGLVLCLLGFSRIRSNLFSSGRYGSVSLDQVRPPLHLRGTVGVGSLCTGAGLRGSEMERGVGRMGHFQFLRETLFSVFVDNIPGDKDASWLRKVFDSAGNIMDVFIPSKERRASNSHFGFVRFKELEEALAAINRWNGSLFEREAVAAKSKEGSVLALKKKRKVPLEMIPKNEEWLLCSAVAELKAFISSN